MKLMEKNMSCHYNEIALEQLKEEGESMGLEGEQLEHFVEEQFEQRAG